ncbi:MAG: serine hydrolase, partial [Actinomycetota bacterium]
MTRLLKRAISIAAITLLLVVSATAGTALAEDIPPPPLISGKAAMLINADSGRVLYSFNQDERLPMASTTKMMTALLVIEDISDLNSGVTVSQRAAEVGESSIWLTAGETQTVHEMLTGLLVQSGNDAAMALAEFDAGSMEAFVEKMNKRAQELGLNNTHFANP